MTPRDRSSFIPCGGRERRLDNTDGYNGHKRCYKDEDCRAKGCLKTRQEIACKLIILRTTCFLHQNTSQLLWFKEKTLLQSKFCCKLKSSISKVSKCGVHSVARLKKKRGGTAIIRTQNQPPLKKRQMCWFWCEADFYYWVYSRVNNL